MYINKTIKEDFIFTNIKFITVICIINFIQMAYFAPALFGFSQIPEIKFDHISIEEGLSENVVLSLSQDERGFIWIGTQDGLNRYDGNRIKVFRNDLDDPQSLSNSYISAIFTDQAGFLWIGTAKGLNRFDPKTETFIRYLNDPENQNSISSDNITAIYQDRSGALWVGTGDAGLNEFKKETDSFIRHQHQERNSAAISYNNIRVISEDHAGFIWVGTFGGGLNRLDKTTGEFIQYKADPADPHTISHENITAIFEDSHKRLWIGTDGGGLNQLDRESGQFIHYKTVPNDRYSISHNSITGIYEDKTGLLWVGTTGGGLSAYDPQKKKFARYQHDAGNNQSLSTNNTTAIIEDDAGILWFGTENGISKFDRFRLKFAHYRHHPGKENGLSGSTVTAILQDRSGTLWVGTQNGGLNKFDAQENRFIHYKHDPNNSQTIGDGSIYSIFEDKSGRIWIGTQNGGLNRFDPKTESFVRYVHEPGEESSLSHNFVWPIYEDSKGFLWVGTWGGGLNKFIPETGRFFQYKNDPDNTNSLSNDQLSSILEDSKGKLWVGTFQGLNMFDPETGVFKHFVHDPKDPESLSNNAAISLCEDRSGVIWVGTLSGLNRFDRKTNTFSHYGKKDGLPNEVITSIVEDDSGMLWMSTFNGISRFDPQKETFRNYNVDDGLQSKRFKANAHFKANDGQIFFGGINGFNAFYPEQIKDNTYIPPIVLTDFQLFNQSVKPGPGGVLTKSITESNHVEISYKDSVFSLEFSSLHFSAPETILYAYKLEGFDKEWLYTDAEKRFATYTNLDGGTYTFKVKGTNSDGVWNEEGPQLTITVKPRFWKTNWFYSILISGVLLLVGFTALYFNKLKFEIKERNFAEESLRREKRFAETVINSQQDTFFLFEPQTGKAIRWNKSFNRITGYSDEEIAELKAPGAYYDPEGLEKAKAFIAKVIETGVGTIELDLICKDGRRVPTEYGVSVIKDKKGTPKYCISIGRDLTERKQLEMRFQQLAENSTDWIWEFDENNIFTYSSPGVTNLLGYTPEEVIGKSAFDLIPSPEKERVAEEFEKSKGPHEPFTNLQNINQHKDGHLVTIESSGSPIFNANGEFKGYRGIDRDISERKQMEEELRQAHKMESIGTLAGGIAHDFNNILGIVIGYSELALGDLPEWSPAHNNIQEIKTASLRAKDVVRQLLSFSRKTEQEQKPIDIIEVVKESIQLIRSSIPSSVEIHDEIPEKIDTILADATQIHQVLINLCTNASHSMTDNSGLLEIILQPRVLKNNSGPIFKDLPPGKYVELTIKDTGLGIDPRILDKIFDPYFTTKEVGKGTGMGLAVVHGIVQNHKGGISVDSKPGKGTAITILFPAIEVQPQQNIEDAALNPNPSGKETILFVDDEEALVDMAKLILEKLGYTVHVYTDPTEALTAFSKEPARFDLVITDMTMPQMSGVKLSEKIREIQNDMPIIICTGHSSLLNEEKAKDISISAFAMKPVTMAEIAKLIRNVLDG